MVAVPVELDLTIADGLREALLGVLNAGALGLVVDMTHDHVLRLGRHLRHHPRRAAGRRARRRPCGSPSPRTAVLRVLDLVGIDRLIEIYPDATAALASLPDHASNLS